METVIRRLRYKLVLRTVKSPKVIGYFLVYLEPQKFPFVNFLYDKVLPGYTGKWET